jgi:hypothetical protein
MFDWIAEIQGKLSMMIDFDSNRIATEIDFLRRQTNKHFLFVDKERYPQNMMNRSDHRLLTMFDSVLDGY